MWEMNPTLSDNELIENASNGNRSAFETLYMKYKVKIFNYVYRLSGDRGAAEEITQKTFINVYRHLHQYRPGRSAAPWIYRIAQNFTRHHFKQRTHTPEMISIHEEKNEQEPGNLEDSLSAKGPNPLDTLKAREYSEAIQKLISTLPEKYRAVLILHDIQELSYEEIQDILRIPYNTAAGRLAKARMMLKKRIDPKKFNIEFYFSY
ncbi:MAG: hypothetical protein A3G33_05395 [Omnitrophica bacterium RIFCSPLOWO2_12_FULL_44_17]|uniref:RNA polymerase sigma factor n=1 Tax=Candidatus Danuiimicrobium aquiferis TaxID=1801832 RepID=A0A1G1L0Q1_9BACT|nr:MAG: hypothetical protein A3B72_04665 [Omnitrophica bacterium RIFCSPHIGHO2_02_FULL_45_28]OGW98708.1 MAG: hypothetical protein A3G33_05395 [Omnitrophica bacterium RIFCSPLOWO2_12_FULL_44_17]OGX03383.1 MAG: hypothetical protein A3J12_00845 [Omnitrophica bacterium RIFCSPLOWO2_02_FULL_44_11]